MAIITPNNTTHLIIDTAFFESIPYPFINITNAINTEIAAKAHKTCLVISFIVFMQTLHLNKLQIQLR